MAISKILVTIPFKDNQKEKLLSAAQGQEIEFLSAQDVTEEIVADKDVLIGNLPIPMIQAAAQLKWLQLNSAGANQFCAPGILKEDTILTSASGAYSISVAENMLAYTLMMMKKMPVYLDNQKQHIWRDEGDVTSAYGATVVVLGLGNIGLYYARAMKALGSYTIGIKRHAGTAPEGIDELHTMDELDACLQRADVVACVLPSTAETVNVLNKSSFKAMKDTAYLINVGRGNEVDPDALYEALTEGQIAGAAIDVTEPEPLPAEDKLWNAPNLIITPHIAGKFHIPVTLEIISDICAENIRHYLAGEKLINVVDRSIGY